MKTYQEMAVVLDAWTPELCTAAQREGWDLSTATGNSPLQVQRTESHLAFDAVAVAMGLVLNGTGEHHKVARKIIQDHFPEEWAIVQKHAV